MNFQEFPDGSVIGFFYIIGKVTGGQLPLHPMVVQALTTVAFSWTSRIGTIAMFEILFPGDADLFRHASLLVKMLE
jgi:hypothetical protein